MKRLSQRGALDVFALLFVGATVLLIVSIVFGVWAFTERSDYKNKSDEKSAAAVTVALADQEVKLNADFEEKEKSPYEKYVSPASFGTVSITYPKTWSAYVEEAVNTSAIPINGYFQPGFVHSVSSGSSYALRLQITNRPLADELLTYSNFVKSGTATATALSAKNVPGSGAGYKVKGEIATNTRGEVVLFELRDKTIKIWTESEDFISDLEGIVLENLTFIP